MPPMWKMEWSDFSTFGFGVYAVPRYVPSTYSDN
jgi:hypothetical protein